VYNYFFKGCCPVEDSGNLPGWEYIKDAYRSTHPTPEQQEVSGLGDQFNPFAEPDVAVLNNEERWDKFFGVN
jgi:hypothetical protein